MYVFRDGIPGWLQAGFGMKSIEKLPKSNVRTILPSDLNRMIEEKEKFFLVDIRIPSQARDYAIDHPSRLLISIDDLQEKYRQLPRDRTIVLIDLNGRRSPIAGRFLQAKGFTDLVKVNGGMYQWLQDGLPVSKGD